MAQRDSQTSPASSSHSVSDKQLQAPATDQRLDAPAISQGGTRAWLVVLGGFFAFVNIWGFPISFGVFQNFYVVDYLHDKSESDVSWMGTTKNFLVSMVSVLSGPIYDLGYYRTLVFSGSFQSVFGIMMLSLSKRLGIM